MKWLDCLTMRFTPRWTPVSALMLYMWSCMPVMCRAVCVCVVCLPEHRSTHIFNHELSPVSSHCSTMSQMKLSEPWGELCVSRRAIITSVCNWAAQLALLWLLQVNTPMCTNVKIMWHSHAHRCMLNISSEHHSQSVLQQKLKLEQDEVQGADCQIPALIQHWGLHPKPEWRHTDRFAHLFLCLSLSLSDIKQCQSLRKVASQKDWRKNLHTLMISFQE